MVTAGVIAKRFNLPRYVVYKLVEDGAIPYEESPAPFWDKTKRRRLLFNPADVDAALKRLKEERPGYG